MSINFDFNSNSSQIVYSYYFNNDIIINNITIQFHSEQGLLIDSKNCKTADGRVLYWRFPSDKSYMSSVEKTHF